MRKPWSPPAAPDSGADAGSGGPPPRRRIGDPSRGFGSRNAGYTVIELLVVMTITAIGIGLAAQAYSRYSDRNATRRSAELFTRDLGLTRSTALRERQPVRLCVTPGDPGYTIETESERLVATRRFDRDSGGRLSFVGLELPGGCVVFDRRGLADLSGGPAPVGMAEFRSNSAATLVVFNAMGVTRFEAQ